MPEKFIWFSSCVCSDFLSCRSPQSGELRPIWWLCVCASVIPEQWSTLQSHNSWDEGERFCRVCQGIEADWHSRGVPHLLSSHTATLPKEVPVQGQSVCACAFVCACVCVCVCVCSQSDPRRTAKTLVTSHSGVQTHSNGAIKQK